MDDLAKVIAEALYGPLAAELIANKLKAPNFFAQAEQESLKAANAVRAYLESDEVVERAALGAVNWDQRRLDMPEISSLDEFRDEADQRVYVGLSRAALQAAGGKQDG